MEGFHPSGSPTFSNLLTRVLVGVALIPVVIVFVHLGGFAFACFVSLIALGGYTELAMMMRSVKKNASLLAGGLGCFAVCLAFSFGIETAATVLSLAVVMIIFERLVRCSQQEYGEAVGTSIFGLVYTGWLLGHFIMLRNPRGEAGVRFGEISASLIYLVLVGTWTYDTSAYLIGTAFGRHRIFTRISPSKTLEGTLGGIAGSVAAFLISRGCFARFLGIKQAVGLAISLGIVAQVGDLIESMIKRTTGVKDSSHILPGHGGVLDRFDSLLLTGPFMYYYARFFLR